jgi:transcription initiation factor TFIIIB Brf1 subunit/transcription initiation factor TFIIB
MSQKAVRQRRDRSKVAYRGLKTEIILKLVFSWAIAIAALTSAIRLLPYHLSQQEKLKELHIQVQDTEARVVKLQEQLNRNFDPQQTKNLMEQYSSLLAPNQTRIYWLPEERHTNQN